MKQNEKETYESALLIMMHFNKFNLMSTYWVSASTF